MLKKIAIIATIIVGVTSFIYMMSSFSLSEVFQPFSNASITSILVFIAVSFLMSATLTLRWHIITKSFNLKIPFWSLYSVRLAGYPVGYLTPGPRVGGEPVMASLLKKKGVPFIKSISTLVIDRTIEGTMLGTFFIIGLLVVLLNFALPAKTKIIMIFVAILFALAIFYFYYRTLQGHDFFHKILRVLRLNKLKFIKKYESKIFAFEKVLISFYNKQKKAFLLAILLSIATWILMYFEYSSALAIIGQEFSIISIFIIISFMGAALLFPIPAAIGSQEAGHGSAVAITKMKSSLGFSLSLLIRVRDLIWVFIGLFILFYYGLNSRTILKKVFKKSLTAKRVKIKKGVDVYIKNN